MTLCKNRTLLVLKYLWENTDEHNSVSLADISKYISSQGLPDPYSRSLKKDISDLLDFGIDIVCERNKQNQYSIVSRSFDTAEIKLLIDAIQSSKFITAQKSEKLISKLSVFVNPDQHDLLRRQLYMENRVKADNEQILIIVDKVFTAITSEKKLSFTYFDYSPSKKRIHRHNGRIYTVSPYDMMWSNDNYYFTAYDDREEEIHIYRADRVDDLEILDTPAILKPIDYSVEAYHSKVFSMYMGPIYQVELLCENDLMNSIIDRFGENVYTRIIDNQHFLVRTTIALSDLFFGWVFSSGGKMKILSPPSIVEMFRQKKDCFQ